MKPHPNPAKTASGIEPVDFMMVAAKQALMATFAPIDKSSPAVRITRVKPDASRNSNEACLNTLVMLVAVKKEVLKKLKARHSNPKAKRRAMTLLIEPGTDPHTLNSILPKE